MSPEKERRDEGCAQLNGEGAGVDGGQVVDDAGLELGADVGGGGELALGQAVDAVVFDDVDHGQIAAQQVHELADADGGGVAVAGDAEHDHRAGWRAWRRWTTEGMRPCTLLKP